MIEAILMLNDAALGRLVRAVLTGKSECLKGTERLLFPVIREIIFVPLESLSVSTLGAGEE